MSTPKGEKKHSLLNNSQLGNNHDDLKLTIFYCFPSFSHLNVGIYFFFGLKVINHKQQRQQQLLERLGDNLLITRKVLFIFFLSQSGVGTAVDELSLPSHTVYKPNKISNDPPPKPDRLLHSEEGNKEMIFKKERKKNNCSF